MPRSPSRVATMGGLGASNIFMKQTAGAMPVVDNTISMKNVKKIQNALDDKSFAVTGTKDPMIISDNHLDKVFKTVA